MNVTRVIWPLIAISAVAVVVVIRPVDLLRPSGKQVRNREGEFYAWEKTPQGQYKQVKKNYFMDEPLCNNVIGVLNNMSTKKPPSNSVLSQTTDSAFECWPVSIDPNEYYRKYSVHSDQPTDDSVRNGK